MLVLIRRTQRGPVELAGQVEGHEPGQAGGIAGVGLDDFPAPVVAPALDRRRLEGDAGRRGRVIGLRVGVFDPAGQAEDQRGRRADSG